MAATPTLTTATPEPTLFATIEEAIADLRLMAALARHGVDAQLVTFAGGHGFAGLGGDAIVALFEQEAAWLKRRLGS